MSISSRKGRQFVTINRPVPQKEMDDSTATNFPRKRYLVEDQRQRRPTAEGHLQITFSSIRELWLRFIVDYVGLVMMLESWCLAFWLTEEVTPGPPSCFPNPLCHSPDSSASSSLCFNFVILISTGTFIVKNGRVQMKSDVNVSLNFNFQNFPVL